jgi:hypothetical protein
MGYNLNSNATLSLLTTAVLLGRYRMSPVCVVAASVPEDPSTATYFGGMKGSEAEKPFGRALGQWLGVEEEALAGRGNSAIFSGQDAVQNNTTLNKRTTY